jgi:hypothetical protein
MGIRIFLRISDRKSSISSSYSIDEIGALPFCVDQIFNAAEDMPDVFICKILAKQNGRRHLSKNKIYGNRYRYVNPHS